MLDSSMTTWSLRIGVGSGLGVLLGSIVLLCLVGFVDRFLRSILPRSLKATFCTEGFRITISSRPFGVDRAVHAVHLGHRWEPSLTGYKPSTDCWEYLSRSPDWFRSEGIFQSEIRQMVFSD
jgi:hypothetical protein